jgi:hypothetical protein
VHVDPQSFWEPTFLEGIEVRSKKAVSVANLAEVSAFQEELFSALVRAMREGPAAARGSNMNGR